MDILGKLFGTTTKVRIIKLFLFNPEGIFDVSDVAKRVSASLGLARREISNFEKAGFIKVKEFSKEIKKQKNRKVISVSKKTLGWILNYKFKNLEQLYNFVSEINTFNLNELVDKLSKGIKLELLVLSGFFIKESDSRLDMLVVGEGIKYPLLEDILKSIESDIGREIKYCILDTTEFKYRVSVFDRLVRDVFDFPHEKIVNKLNI